MYVCSCRGACPSLMACCGGSPGSDPNGVCSTQPIVSILITCLFFMCQLGCPKWHSNIRSDRICPSDAVSSSVLALWRMHATAPIGSESLLIRTFTFWSPLHVIHIHSDRSSACVLSEPYSLCNSIRFMLVAHLVGDVTVATIFPLYR
jgi:hypothetical protein